MIAIPCSIEVNNGEGNCFRAVDGREKAGSDDGIGPNCSQTGMKLDPVYRSIAIAHKTLAKGRVNTKILAIQCLRFV